MEPCGQDQNGGPDQVGQHVADSGNQSEQRIESDREGRAWDFERGIQILAKSSAVSTRVSR
jgi:hypothetical protein